MVKHGARLLSGAADSSSCNELMPFICETPTEDTAVHADAYASYSDPHRGYFKSDTVSFAG